MNFWLVNMCWPFSQQVLTKSYIRDFLSKITFFHGVTSKFNATQDMCLWDVTMIKNHSYMMYLKIVSHPGWLYDLERIFMKIDFFTFFKFFEPFFKPFSHLWVNPYYQYDECNSQSIEIQHQNKTWYDFFIVQHLLRLIQHMLTKKTTFVD